METWVKVWREGIAPQLSTNGLIALRKALETDDSRLIQGATTTPPPLACVRDWDCDAADAIGYVGWQGDNLQTVGEVEEFFARVCFECDQAIGEPAGCRHFINAWDESPRDEMRVKLLAEVNRTLAERDKIDRPYITTPCFLANSAGCPNTTNEFKQGELKLGEVWICPDCEPNQD